MNKAQNIMREIYDTYATYGVYKTPMESQRKPSSPFGMPTNLIDTYHDHMLHSYERAKNLFNEVDDECGAYDEFPMEDLLDALNYELKYIKHFKKIHILLATIPSPV